MDQEEQKIIGYKNVLCASVGRKHSTTVGHIKKFIIDNSVTLMYYCSLRGCVFIYRLSRWYIKSESIKMTSVVEWDS